DVSGHGTPAAVVMAILHTLLHTYPGSASSPRSVLRHVNQHLFAVAPEGMFATGLYGVYDPAERRLWFAVAGHLPPPLPRRNQVRPMEKTEGLPLGVMPEDTWTETELVLEPGDLLLLYTDGIVEGRNNSGQFFGRERLENALLLGPSRAAPLVAHIERHFR